MSGQVSCPKGCGDLEYKNERPGNTIVLFSVGAISLVVAVYELLFDGDLFLPFMFGVVGLWLIYYGFSMGKLSYFMKQKDRTYHNYSTQYEQNSWNFIEN